MSFSAVLILQMLLHIQNLSNVARHKYDQSISQKNFCCLILTNYLISKLWLSFLRVVFAIVLFLINLNFLTVHHDFLGSEGLQGTILMHQAHLFKINDIDPEMRFENLFGDFSPLCGAAWCDAAATFCMSGKPMINETCLKGPMIYGEGFPCSSVCM